MEVGNWMRIETYHNELRMAAREVARKMWVIYSELIRAGFSEDQSLVLLLELTAKEKGGE